MHLAADEPETYGVCWQAAALIKCTDASQTEGVAQCSRTINAPGKHLEGGDGSGNRSAGGHLRCLAGLKQPRDGIQQLVRLQAVNQSMLL